MAVLFINRYDSRCGDCGRNADPAESSHRMEKMRGVGCGAEFTAVGSDYRGGIEEVASEMRPDLPWTDDVYRAPTKPGPAS